ncbi:MAG: S46 family peptidase [Bacteroidales bacterium]
MKKISLLLICAFIFGTMPMKADEGMWMLPLLEKLNIKKMQELGLKLSAEDIYSINHSSLKDAIVHFGGGCTGEVVSDKGLLFTNHHCGYGTIQKLSTVEHDYLNNGYWAMNLKEELPAEGLSVTFIDKFTDVTSRIEKAIAKAKDDQDKDKRYTKEVETIVKEATKQDPTLKATVTSFYNGNAYYLVTTRTFKDIRFVGAPPSSIGKFGADTDNWMWPRHTGDFSVFRIYADKNNNPADYSPDNVPYTPKQSLTISLKGVKPNDYTMIIGFPGRTTRFMTSEEAKETQDINNAISIYTRGAKQDIWMNDMQADPKVRIQYASKYAGSSNGWKKWIGMNETFGKLKVIERRKADEAKFTEWVNADPARVAKYGKALEKINTAVKNRADAAYVLRYLNETVNAIELTRMTSPRMASRYEDFYKDYSMPTDKKLAKTVLKIYRDKVDKQYLPSFYAIIDKDFGGDIDKYVDHLFATSVYADINKYKAALDSKADLTNDPANVLTKSVGDVSSQISKTVNTDSKTYSEGKKEYVAGILEMRGNNAMYPDANSTMRLTYGQVLPYSPRDAVEYDYVTTLDGVMQKEDPNNWEFVVPVKLKELYKAQDYVNAKYGSYALENGKMPVAFLANTDITGGNSGSPILNAKGELLGLAFDGNWEAMSGDVIFEPSLQRCINVDVRYVLFIIDKFGGAGYLLDEMKIAR